MSGGAAPRKKGHDFERWVANQLRRVFPDAKRGLGQTRDGSDVPDVQGTPYWWEAKVGQRPNIQKAVQQALDASLAGGDGRPVVVVSKKDRCAPLVTLHFEDFVKLLENVYGARDGYEDDGRTYFSEEDL
jgi:hypothetical protein